MEHRFHITLNPLSPQAVSPLPGPKAPGAAETAGDASPVTRLGGARDPWLFTPWPRSHSHGEQSQGVNPALLIPRCRGSGHGDIFSKAAFRGQMAAGRKASAFVTNPSPLSAVTAKHDSLQGHGALMIRLWSGAREHGDPFERTRLRTALEGDPYPWGPRTARDPEPALRSARSSVSRSELATRLLGIGA